MLNQLKRSLSLISGLILCINSVWLLSQGQRHFAIALSSPTAHREAETAKAHRG